jgi:hypothetical protein
LKCSCPIALESAWFRFQPLSLRCDILVSKFAFKCNLCRYTAVLKHKIEAPKLEFSASAKVGRVQVQRRVDPP